MIEEHEVTHLPFRNWCSGCVRGRVKSIGHYAVDKDDEQIPTISIDYGFFGRDGEQPEELVTGQKAPVLIVKDRQSKAVFSHPVPSKGTEHPYATKVLMQDLDELGYKRITLKCDQEHALNAVVKAVKREWTGEIVPVHVPKVRSPRTAKSSEPFKKCMEWPGRSRITWSKRLE